MDFIENQIAEIARPETLPDIPKKIRWKARLLGKQVIKTYYRRYYER